VNVNLNLASKPFNNRLLPWLLTVAILFVSLIGLIIVVRLTTSLRSQTALAETRVNKLKQEEQGLMARADELKKSFTTEQQQALKAAHELIDRKNFSWSRLLADLEGSLANDVRVTRISVRDVGSEGGQTIADLDLVVFSKSSETVIDMIESINKEGVFYATLVNQNLQKGRGEIGTECELAVVYRPRAGFASENPAEMRAASKATTGEAK
jgi:Tfp pilus assembly protein PilN